MTEATFDILITAIAVFVVVMAVLIPPTAVAVGVHYAGRAYRRRHPKLFVPAATVQDTTGLQDDRSRATEEWAIAEFYRRSRTARQHRTQMTKNPALVHGFFQAALRNPHIASAVDDANIGTPTIQLTNLPCTNGLCLVGRATPEYNLIEIGFDGTNPITILHELAHLVAGADHAHDAVWAATYESFVRAMYPGKVADEFEIIPSPSV